MLTINTHDFVVDVIVVIISAIANLRTGLELSGGFALLSRNLNAIEGLFGNRQLVLNPLSSTFHAWTFLF